MSSLKVNEITNAAGTGAPDFEDGIKYAGSSILKALQNQALQTMALYGGILLIL